MMIRQFACNGFDPDKAAQAAAQVLRVPGRGAPRWLAVHHSAQLDPEAVRAAFALAFPGTALHGGTSCLGVMTGNGPFIAGGDGLGAFAVWDESGDYGVGVAPLGHDPRAAGRAAALAALDAAGRPGEAPDLVWLTATPGAEEAVLAGIEEAIGSATPVVGGSAADNDVTGGWAVFAGESVSRSGVVVSVLFPEGRTAVAFQSGYAPAGPSGIATRVEGRRLLEIDGRPARSVYAGWTGGKVVPADPGAASILAASTWSPLGREAGAVAGIPFHLLAHPATAEADGAVGLFADLRAGERLHLMAGEPASLAARAGRTARLALDAGRLAAEDVAGALVVFCGGSMLAMREGMGPVVEGLDRALGGAPFLGVFTFGEQGPALDGRNRHGNLMISATVFAGER